MCPSFIFNFDQDSNPKKISKSIEIVYGLRNFIGNANKFSKNTIFINLKSDSEITEITVEDDGNGYPRDIISKNNNDSSGELSSDDKQCRPRITEPWFHYLT